MLPEASSEDLLYVTNYFYVSVYSYPAAKLVGELKHFYNAAGECVDSKGDVFIVNTKPSGVFEYAHGATKRTALLLGKKAGTAGCSINPVNGDLALSGVTNYVDIFKGAKGKPTLIRDSDMWYGGFVAYDDKGDLFFLGLRNTKGQPRLSELPSGSGHFIDISADALMYDEGGLQWDSGYLTSVAIVKGLATAIGQFQVTGSKAHEVSVTHLDTAYQVVQYFIDGSTVLAPNLEKDRRSDVLFCHYPRGGKPILLLTKDITEARGVALSRDTVHDEYNFPSNL